MKSSTSASCGLPPPPVQRITSLSVRTPTTRRSSWLSTTGTSEVCSSSIRRAACAIVSCRVTTGGLSIITSLTFMDGFSLFLYEPCVPLFEPQTYDRHFRAHYITRVWGGQAGRTTDDRL